MHALAIELFRTARDTHAKLHGLLLRLDKEVKNSHDLKELADIAYAVDEVRKLADDTRRESAAVNELSEKLCCALWTVMGSSEPIRTATVTATPDSKLIATLPSRKKQPEEYKTLMIGLGMAPEAADQDIFKPHWPGIMDHITRLASEGKPLPPGIDPGKTYTQYKLVFRAKKEVGGQD